MPHAQRVIENDDATGPTGEPEHPGEVRALPDRAGHSQHQQDHSQCPQCQQNPLLDLQTTLVRLQSELEILHGRPVDPDEPLTVQQVNDDRRTGEQQTEEQTGEKEGH